MNGVAVVGWWPGITEVVFFSTLVGSESGCFHRKCQTEWRFEVCEQTEVVVQTITAQKSQLVQAGWPFPVSASEGFYPWLQRGLEFRTTEKICAKMI